MIIRHYEVKEEIGAQNGDSPQSGGISPRSHSSFLLALWLALGSLASKSVLLTVSFQMILSSVWLSVTCNFLKNLTYYSVEWIEKIECFFQKRTYKRSQSSISIWCKGSETLVSWIFLEQAYIKNWIRHLRENKEGWWRETFCF